MTIFFNMYVYSACKILGSVENIPINIQEKHFLMQLKRAGIFITKLNYIVILNVFVHMM